MKFNSSNVFFTSDEHYGHQKIIEYCDRPFNTYVDMDSALINLHNSVVKNDSDVVFHLGDFSLYNDVKYIEDIINNLNGKHVFLRGNHDRWLKSFDKLNIENKLYTKEVRDILVIYVNRMPVVLCHYCMRVFPKKHYGAIHFYGHTHGKMESFDGCLDIGVDTNDYCPYSFEEALLKLKI